MAKRYGARMFGGYAARSGYVGRSLKFDVKLPDKRAGVHGLNFRPEKTGRPSKSVGNPRM